MNASGREGWHSSQQQQPPSATPTQQQPQPPQPPQSQSQSQLQAQAQSQPQLASSSGAPVLPPPPAAFFSNPPPAHNLPGLADLTQASQASQPSNFNSQHPQAHPQSEPAHSNPQQPPSYAMPGIGQHQLQAHPSIENEREQRERESREMEELARRDAEQRERELRERQHREHENHVGSIQIHQPVAIPPRVQSIHGPSGLLGNPGPASQSSAAQGVMGVAQALFGVGPVHQGDPSARLQQPTHQQQPQILVPFAAQGGQQPAGGMNQAQQPILNDALSYLDQVKVQFADHPDVYNRFLDIMKDFKSGAIDTPGVIERVSHLFAGNPGLIQGFNTFLPPGYKIECGTGDDPNSIRVTTPMGTTISQMPASRPLSAPRAPAVNGNPPVTSEGGFYDAAVRMGWQHQPAGGAQDNAFNPEGRPGVQAAYGAQRGPTSHPPLSPEAHREQQAAAAAAAAIHQQEQRGVSHLQNAAAAASAGALPSRVGLLSSPGDSANPLQAQILNGVSPGMQQAMANGGLEKRGPVEFNHAISYVNKIKNRFAQQPDIYKQFLEILQTYQRESKPIQDVYAQVTRLFETAPDLLEDFKQFLPESAAQSKAAARSAGEEVFPLSSTRTDTSYAAAVSAHNHLHQTPRPEQPRLPPMGNFAPTPSTNRDNKRKRGERQGLAPAVASSVGPEASNGPRAGLNQTTNGNKRMKGTHATKQVPGPELPTATPSLVPSLPTPMPPTTSLSASTDDIAFFDRVRKHISNKGQYGEFLKLVNLFTQDLCTEQYLIFRAQSFIGNSPELMTYFKGFVHFEPSDEIIANQPKHLHGKILLSNCRGMGPSYRLLPKLEKHKKCSGRDGLCNSVLNDEWVSHPTWASEDSGFVAHRKNAHEEGLHRVEEERHDYDFYIESCNRTIQLLVPIAQNLTTATPEARRQFSLDPKLGGQSEAIYRRVIYKIYGREKGNEVLANLFARPYDVVPILLTRLKVKMSEWKAAQIQWERVWRQQTNMLFYKSLDHQGVATRVADKRQFWPKQLINESQVRYHEQKRQREIRPSSSPASLYTYSFDDTNVLSDAVKLVISYSAQNFSTDHPKLASLLKDFFSLFFLLDSSNFELDGRQSNGSPEDGDESSPGPEDGSSPRHKSNSKQKTLLRGVLDRPRGATTGKRDNDSAASDSRGTSPENMSVADEDLMDTEASPKQQNTAKIASSEKWFQHPIDSNFVDGQSVNPTEQYQRQLYSMYCNATMYCFMRVFALLYERLVKVKANEDEVHRIVKRAQLQKPARDLGWIEKFPENFFIDTSAHANYYGQMLDMFHGVIKGEGEMNHVEETLRRYYLQDGWQLYSLDKLLSSISRFASSMVTSDGRDKSAEIYQLFKRDRARGEYTSTQDEINYRKQVDKHIKEGDLYQLAYNEHAKTVLIQLFKHDDPTFDPTALSVADRWKVYVTAYEAVEPTEGVKYPRIIEFPYLRRGVRQQWGEDQPSLDAVVDDSKSSESLIFRILQNGEPGYVLKFEPGESEYAVSGDPKVSIAEVAEEAEKRGGVASEITQLNSEWMKGMSKDQVDKKKQSYAELIATR